MLLTEWRKGAALSERSKGDQVIVDGMVISQTSHVVEIHLFLGSRLSSRKFRKEFRKNERSDGGEAEVMEVKEMSSVVNTVCSVEVK